MIMENDFIHKSLKVSAMVILLFVPFLFVYLGPRITLGFLAGAIWNIANVFLLSRVFTMITSPGPSNKVWGFLLGILKFPFLYGIGYIIIRYINVALYALIVGFTLVLLILVLRVVGAYLNNIFYPGKRSYGRGT